jgi:Uma2 family endonuclease
VRDYPQREVRKLEEPRGGRLAISVQLHRRLFTVEEYYRMAESGILSAAERVELIELEIVAMAATGGRHAAYVDRLDTCSHNAWAGLPQ